MIEEKRIKNGSLIFNTKSSPEIWLSYNKDLESADNPSIKSKTKYLKTVPLHRPMKIPHQIIENRKLTLKDNLIDSMPTILCVIVLLSISMTIYFLLGDSVDNLNDN